MKNRNILIGLVVLIIIAGGYYSYREKQKETYCLSRINYSGDAKTYEITYLSDNPLDVGATIKTFKTHDEAMQWCKEVLFK